MKIFATHQIKELDAYTISHEPIDSIDLMERAAEALVEAITQRWEEKETPFVLFAGPGNNGGDALAVARLLSQRGYEKVKAYLFNPLDKLSDDCRTNMERLMECTEVDFYIVS